MEGVLLNDENDAAALWELGCLLCSCLKGCLYF